MKHPSLVAAGAGAGKTWRIVQAVTARVAAGTPVERVAAVTFTEAAAAELQERLRASLSARGLHAQAARVDAAAVCTIHRFALTLLQRYPLAAGLAPDARVLDEDEAASLRRRVLSELVDRGAARELPVLLEGILGAGVGLPEHGWGDAGTPLERLHQLLRELLEKGRSVGMDARRLRAEGPAAAARLVDALGDVGGERHLDGTWREALDGARAKLDAAPEPRFKKDHAFYDALRGVLASGDDVPVYDAALRLSGAELSKAAAPDFGPLVAASDRVVDAHPELRRRVAEGVAAAFSLAADVLDRYQEEKARLGAVDFEDMQLRALDLLAGRGSAGAPYASLVAAALPFVVVDEFQDTSPLQFRLFEALRAAGTEVEYVGDLKQGIYGFRAADATLFEALLHEAEARGEAPETLDRSRRSRPELVGFANALFARLLPRHGLAYAPLTADNAYARGACPKEVPSVDVVHARDRVAASVERLAALVASGLPVLDRATGRPRPVRWSDCAILSYTHESLRRHAEALRARGVPAVLASRGLHDTLEVSLATAWLRMVASPRDTAAAASVLLSELYGLSQRAVATLALARAVASPAHGLRLADEHPDRVPLTDFERRALARCDDDLRACRAAFRQLPLAEAVERALARVELAERLSLKRDAAAQAQARANLAALVATAWRVMRADDLSADGVRGATLESFLLELEREARRDPWQPTPEAEGVRLVTLHASKGMEYPVVVLDVFAQKTQARLPRVEVVRPADRATLLGEGSLAACGVQVVPDVGVTAWRDRLRAVFGGRDRAESEWARLLYVAVTRARDHLVLLWPDEAKPATGTLRAMVAEVAPDPPREAGASTWLDTAVTVTLAGGKLAPAPAPTVPDLAAWRSLAEDESPESSAPPPVVDVRPRLARVSPSELCQVADCPEVPRLVRFSQGELHHVARSTGAAVTVREVPGARRSREAVGRRVPAVRLGKLVHLAIERATLREAPTPGTDEALAREVLTGAGETEHRDALAALVVDTLASVRGVAAALGATEEPWSEVPFAIDLDGTTLHGIVDLVVPGDGGLHVVDLKTHLMARDELPVWAAYYRPQLDAYALAVERLTGARVAGRHLAVPAAGVLVTLDGPFVAAHAEAALASHASLLARGVPGPTQDCARCGWRELCRVGRAARAKG
ncbi:MAG: UvrD-helicase domain-containing protein [Polyangiales bacterium]